MGIDDSDRHDEIEEHLKSLERRLAGWRPAVGALDRDRVLYHAGQAAARADTYVQAWRLASAALLFLLIGSGWLIARQRSMLVHEQYLLEREQSQRLALETTLAAQTRIVAAEAAHHLGEPPPLEPFAANSYFVLASRHAQGIAEPAWPGAGSPAEERREAGSPDKRPAAAPLRPRDLERILDL
jgi:hypothetical protein